MKESKDIQGERPYILMSYSPDPKVLGNILRIRLDLRKVIVGVCKWVKEIDLRENNTGGVGANY